MKTWFLLLIGTFLIVACNIKVAFGKSFVVSSESPLEQNEKSNDSTSDSLLPKIYQMTVETNVSNRFAKTLITSKVSNLNSKAQEATFSVVTPDKAFISGFVMRIDGKNYEAYVQEKEHAKQTYDTAVAQGKSAGHVAVSARDSNRFTVSVNIEPASKATFYLTYEELLERKDEKYEIVLNIHPGQPVKDLSVKVNIIESRPLKFVRTTALRSGNEVLKNDPKLDPEADIKTINDTSSVVTFNPDIAKQKVLASSLGGKEEDGVSGQFVVQYDVERDPQGGEVLIESGYFVHFFAPSDLPALKKQVIFVLDTSGSMYGIRITQLKEAMDSILAELKPEDVFSIVDFNSRVHVWNIPERAVSYNRGDDPFLYYHKSGTEAPKTKEQVLPPSFPASAENIESAKQIIKEFHANGGTDIESALEVGLKIVASTADPKSHQPILIFLTDGEPTVGEIDAEKITKKITELNSRKVPIFSLSFGDGADRQFLQKISLKNQGFARHIYEAADSYLQLQNFYKEISSPLLSNVTFKYIDKVYNVTKRHFPILFHGGELYITGRLDEAALSDTKYSPTVEAWGVNGPIELTPKVYQAAGSLERLWAYLTVKQLLEQREVAEDKTGPTQEALKLALKYSFVTDVSSLVVVKPNATSAVNTEDASKLPENTYAGFGSAVPLVSRGYSGASHYAKTGKKPVVLSSSVNSMVVSYHSGFSRSMFASSNSYGYAGSLKSGLFLGKLDTFLSTTIGTDAIAYTESTARPVPPSIPWLQQVLTPNSTLTLDSVVYSLGVGETITDQPECHNSINNSSGNCTLLDQCPQIHANLTDLDTYKKYFCELQQRTIAGVCCPLSLPVP
ncbi:inter-alpha-trypsin inhibitor heavy chain H4-like isoform X3 [Euwallacea similis]|uniref:inter-alpha-trypsin inhibitor heavy chain H4-like isoform X3 n=1 Tax=Euwallacea similis TaxID=1736056 RepID=UPI00344C9BE9